MQVALHKLGIITVALLLHYVPPDPSTGIRSRANIASEIGSEKLMKFRSIEFKDPAKNLAILKVSSGSVPGLSNLKSQLCSHLI